SLILSISVTLLLLYNLDAPYQVKSPIHGDLRVVFFCLIGIEGIDLRSVFGVLGLLIVLRNRGKKYFLRRSKRNTACHRNRNLGRIHIPIQRGDKTVFHGYRFLRIIPYISEEPLSILFQCHVTILKAFYRLVGFFVVDLPSM